MCAALGATRAPVYLVEALADSRGHALPQVDLPGAVLLDDDDRLHLGLLRRDAHSSKIILDVDLELVFGGNELSEDEASERLIVLSLPIGEASAKELRVAKLETLSGRKAAARFDLRHVLHIVRPKQAVDGRAR